MPPQLEVSTSWQVSSECVISRERAHQVGATTEPGRQCKGEHWTGMKAGEVVSINLQTDERQKREVSSFRGVYMQSSRYIGTVSGWNRLGLQDAYIRSLRKCILSYHCNGVLLLPGLLLHRMR